MRRRRKGTRKEAQQTLNSSHESGEIDGVEKRRRFFACYLLTSISPRFKGHTYIGFTLNPRRRIRQSTTVKSGGVLGVPRRNVCGKINTLESCRKFLLHKVQKPDLWLSSFANYNGSNTGANYDLGSDEDRDSTDILQESTQESIEAARKPSDSLGSRGFEENFQNHVSEKDDTSHESSACSKENWIGIMNLLHSREDQRYSSPPNRAESSCVSSFCNIVSYVEDEQLPVSVKEWDKKQFATTFVACEDQLSISRLVYLTKSRS